MGIFSNVLNVGGATAVDLLDRRPSANLLPYRSRASTSPGAALAFGDQALNDQSS